jgi:hypothetical protein
MRKPILTLLVVFIAFVPRPASAEPLTITGGAFVLDIEGDMFTFDGDGFHLNTTAIGVYSGKLFPGRCDPSSAPFGFCAEKEGALVDWSFHSTGAEQLLGTGNAMLDGVNATGVDFLGSMAVNMVPTPLLSGGAGDFDFVAPFMLQATIRGVRSGEELFRREFAGNGLLRVNYEGTLQPGVFAAADETITFDINASQTPEPGTLLLLVSGLGGVVLQRARISKA